MNARDRRKYGSEALAEAYVQGMNGSLAGCRVRVNIAIYSQCDTGDSNSIVALEFFGAASFKDVLFERCGLQRASFASSRNERLRFERCDLTGAVGVEALRGASMRFDDVLQNAPVLAQALGIEIVAED